MDNEQPMMHIRLYGEGGRYVELADIKKGKRKKGRRKEKEKIHIQEPMNNHRL
jgi:hypothetical protein